MNNTKLVFLLYFTVRDIMMFSKMLLDKMGFGEGEGPPQGGGEGDGDFATDEVSNPSWYAPIKPGMQQVSNSYILILG